MQTELESICVRGVHSIGSEELRWLDDTRKRLQEAGAGFLASVLQRFVEAAREDRQSAARVLLELLTVVRVFERVETLDAAILVWEQMKNEMHGEETVDGGRE